MNCGLDETITTNLDEEQYKAALFARRNSRNKDYNKCLPEWIDWKTEEKDIPTIVVEIADKIFVQLVQQPKTLNDKKWKEKRRFFRRLIHAVSKIINKNGCVPYQRNRNRNSPFTAAFLGVINKAVKAELFEDVISPSNSPKTSRLKPTQRLIDHFPKDELAAKVKPAAIFVERRTRIRKKYQNKRTGEIKTRYAGKRIASVNPKHPVVSELNKNLKEIESINKQTRWFYPDRGELTEIFINHTAKYIDNYKLGGRLFSNRDGHQYLAPQIREQLWIRSGEGLGCGACEYDFGSMFTSLGYNALLGIAAPRNLYEIFPQTINPEMNKGLRMAAKKMTNINYFTKDRRSALLAFHKVMNTKKRNGQWKQGKKLELALLLTNTMAALNLHPIDIYNAVFKAHPRLAGIFHSTDVGLRLMNIEARIALGILKYFADRGWPIAGLHDSFLAEATKADILPKVMEDVYKKETGFMPRVDMKFRGSTGISPHYYWER